MKKIYTIIKYKDDVTDFVYKFLLTVIVDPSLAVRILCLVIGVMLTAHWAGCIVEIYSNI